MPINVLIFISLCHIINDMVKKMLFLLQVPIIMLIFESDFHPINLIEYEKVFSRNDRYNGIGTDGLRHCR